MHLRLSNFTVGLNFKPQFPCGTVHPTLRFVIPQCPGKYTHLHRVGVILFLRARSYEWSLSPSFLGLWPIWGISFTYADTVLNLVLALSPLHPPLCFFPYVLHNTDLSPFPLGPSFLTRALTGQRTMRQKLRPDFVWGRNQDCNLPCNPQNYS